MSEGLLAKQYVISWGNSKAQSATIRGTTYEARNLQSSTGYHFTVTAMNAAGSGMASNSRKYRTGKYFSSISGISDKRFSK